MTTMAKVISKVTEVKPRQYQKRCALIKVIRVNGEKGHKMGPLCETNNPKAANNGQPAQAAHEAVLNKVIAQVNSTWLPHWLIMYSKNTQWVLYIYFTII